jgi:Sulfotransferase family
MHRIHIVGASPRTGTTLLAEAMVACFDIDLHFEHEARIFARPPRRGRIFLTKAPRDILLGERALAEMPALRLVYLLRDPRNIIVSKHRRAPDRYWAGLKFWKAYTAAARRLADHPRFITVRYEDLISDPDRVQEQLRVRMPFLEVTAPFSRFHEVAQPADDALTALGGVRPIAARRRDQWREHLPRVAGQMQQHGSLAADLIEFGYETDDRWLLELAGIEPDLTPSYWAEHFTRESLARMLRP